jgi:site-specific DNA recombinase
MGVYYPAYHCSKNGHYYRVSKATFEQTIEDVVRRLQVNPEQLDTLLSAIEARWNEKQAKVTADNKILEERRQELEGEIKGVVDRIKVITSPTVIKHLEEEVVNIEQQIAELDNKTDKPEETVNIKVVLQYARYLAEHLSDILLHLRNPLRKAVFFGAIFNTVPTYEDLVGGTQKTAQISRVHELFQIGRF